MIRPREFPPISGQSRADFIPTGSFRAVLVTQEVKRIFVERSDFPRDLASPLLTWHEHIFGLEFGVNAQGRGLGEVAEIVRQTSMSLHQRVARARQEQRDLTDEEIDEASRGFEQAALHADAHRDLPTVLQMGSLARNTRFVAQIMLELEGDTPQNSSI